MAYLASLRRCSEHAKCAFASPFGLLRKKASTSSCEVDRKARCGMSEETGRLAGDEWRTSPAQVHELL